jgi:MFS family permease
LEPIKKDLDLTDTEVSLLPGLAYILFYSVAALPIARLADRYSRRSIIIGGIFVWSVATAGCGLAKSFAQLFIGRTCVGIGEATLTPSAVSMISDYFPRHLLGRAVSIFTSHSLVGAGIAYLSGGYIFLWFGKTGGISLAGFGAIHPWQMAFLVVSLPGFLLVLAMTTVLEPKRRGSVALSKPRVSWSEMLRFVWLNRSPVLYVILGYALVSSGQSGLNVWLPAYFSRAFGWSPGQIGPPLGILNLIFGVSGIIAGGWLADAVRSRGYEDANIRVTIVALAIGLPCTVLLPQSTSLIEALGFYIPSLFCGMVCLGTAAPALPIIVPGELKTQVVALFVLCSNLMGYGLGPTFVGVLNDVGFGSAGSLKYSMSIMSGTLLTFGLIVMILVRPHFLKRAILIKNQ